MLIEQIIETSVEEAWAPWPNMYSYNWLLTCHDQTKISKKNLRVDYYLLLKC